MCKTCASLVGRSVILYYFILAQCGKILAQFLCKSFIIFYCKWANRFSGEAPRLNSSKPFVASEPHVFTARLLLYNVHTVILQNLKRLSSGGPKYNSLHKLNIENFLAAVPTLGTGYSLSQQSHYENPAVVSFFVLAASLP